MQYTEYKLVSYIQLHCSVQAHPFMSYHLIFTAECNISLKILPTSRKVVSADGDSLGPIGEVHLKLKIGKVVFNDRFVILNNYSMT